MVNKKPVANLQDSAADEEAQGIVAIATTYS